MFLVNSRSPHFTATTSSSASESLHQWWHTFSRSYGVNLPSSLTRVLSSALEFSSYLPVSVYGTVALLSRYEAFPGSMGSTTLRKHSLLRHHASMLYRDPDLPKSPIYTLKPGHPTPGLSTLLRPPFTQTIVIQYRNINLFPIAYASRPRLRDRLTLSRLT